MKLITIGQNVFSHFRSSYWTVPLLNQDILWCNIIKYRKHHLNLPFSGLNSPFILNEPFSKSNIINFLPLSLTHQLNDFQISNLPHYFHYFNPIKLIMDIFLLHHYLNSVVVIYLTVSSSIDGK